MATIPSATALLGALILAVPTPAPSQTTVAEGATSWWQLAVFSIDRKAVEELQDEVLDYREAGAIGAYEIRIRRDGEGFDAWVTAEIVDAVRLGELRDLGTMGDRAGLAASLSRRSEPAPEPSLRPSPPGSPRARR